ncbi:MAG: histone deacetylase [Hyphomicrobiaceae bacterium]
MSAPSPAFFAPEVEQLPLPPGHRFPVEKYQQLRRQVEEQGILPKDRIFASPFIARADLIRAHSEHYVDDVLAGTLPADVIRRIGLPWSPTLVRRSLAAVGGTLAAARNALDTGVSGQLAGGTHHAHRDFGSGFCVFNDLAVTTLTLRAEGLVSRLAILDLDVHQGDGNSAILVGTPGVLVVSIQGERNFPFRRVASDLDVELPDGTGDTDYLRALADVLPVIEAHRPDLVLSLSGADPLAEDRLGRLSLTQAGLYERDRIVFEMCRRRGFPVTIAIGGGYGVPISTTVTGYANTFRAARDVFRFAP